MHCSSDTPSSSTKLPHCPRLKLSETAMSAFISPMVELWSVIYYRTAIKKGVGALPEMVGWEECSFIASRGN